MLKAVFRSSSLNRSFIIHQIVYITVAAILTLGTCNRSWGLIRDLHAIRPWAPTDPIILTARTSCATCSRRQG
ncbi:hypothetical protein ATANTOWER_022818 [Ataeniobius toweri]|uniref:Uncharacterized protein n=1 Tax=Ataeniobius toweri TaxID=208326 RepID=A0ABU7CBB7_9TELE|nr:hypothetical protein [Ataeniobius toweri]